jgi:hypothetical protein
MRLLQQEYQHPTQVSRLRLNLYRYAPPSEERVAGMMPDQDGFHLTEDRVGAGTVVASLGFFAEEQQARETFTRRAEELARQGWRPAATPAPQPSLPPGALVGSEPEAASAALAAADGDPERVTIPGDDTPRPVKPA